MFEGLRFNHWKTSEGDDGVVTLTLDRASSSVNAISRAVLDELEQIVERLAIEKPAGVIVHSAKSSGFAVGADVKEFIEYAKHDTVLENIEHGQRVYEALARLPCLERLVHLPRYLDAMVERLKTLADQPGKDRTRMTEYERVAKAFEDAGGAVPLPKDASAALVEVRWLLEEYRVSVFAQRLGTAQPVSPQRIMKALSAG